MRLLVADEVMMSSASYFQICVPAPNESLSGTVVADWIEKILSNRDLAWVALSDVDVAGDVRSQLSVSAREVRVMRTSTLVPLIRKASQVVWASLFFCGTDAQAKMIEPGETYEASVEKATLTVRLVDASYLYVLGEEQVLRGVYETLPPGEIRVGSLKDMEFPE